MSSRFRAEEDTVRPRTALPLLPAFVCLWLSLYLDSSAYVEIALVGGWVALLGVFVWLVHGAPRGKRGKLRRT